MRPTPRIILLLSCVVLLTPKISAADASPSLIRYATTLETPMRDWVDKALQLGDIKWEAAAKRPGRHQQSVRGYSFYAAALLFRNAPGDLERAQETIALVLSQQYDDPGKPWHGTFRRRVNEAAPPQNAVVWRDYDPNWREFIGLTFILCLEHYPEAFDATQREAIHKSLALAAQGALQRRVNPDYSNIALMNAYLLTWCGKTLDQEEWFKKGIARAKEIRKRFSLHQSFAEYNSPTYYGVNLFALAMWRSYPPAPEFLSLGKEMEAGLWQDIARFYHPGLGNLCGPFDRSYGMNMKEYMTTVGIAIALATGEGSAMPPLEKAFNHSHDFAFMPMLAMLGVQPPADLVPQLKTFKEPHYVERPIQTGRHARTAYAWLDHSYMMGAQGATPPKTRSTQYHPATLHWQNADQGIGWMRATSCAPLDANVLPGVMQITCHPRCTPRDCTTLQLDFKANGLTRECFTGKTWRLPGLDLELIKAPEEWTVEKKGTTFEVSFPLQKAPATTHFIFHIQPTTSQECALQGAFLPPPS